MPVPAADDELNTWRSSLKEFFLSIIFCSFGCLSPLRSSVRERLDDGILAFDSIVLARPELGILKDIALEINPSFLVTLLKDSLPALCF